ncbi:MAG: hypothetical protein HY741_22660 [Chloroflexi bacterium]|nr:hypothetical protein [Chloroflexota bacterium]
MIRIRRLQRQDEDGKWFDDSYAIQASDGKVTCRYNLTWEYLGGRLNYQIQQSGLPLEELEQVFDNPRMRWLPVETLDMSFEQATEFLDPQFHIPRLKKRVTLQAA